MKRNHICIFITLIDAVAAYFAWWKYVVSEFSYWKHYEFPWRRSHDSFFCVAEYAGYIIGFHLYLHFFTSLRHDGLIDIK